MSQVERRHSMGLARTGGKLAVVLKVDGESSRRSWSGDSLFAIGVDNLRRLGPLGRSRARMLFATAFAISLLFTSRGAEAMGLGAASVQSRLGQPLRMSFPVSLRPDEDVGCVQVRGRSDDLPAVPNTRTSVVRSGSETRIEISSLRAVDEPAIGLVVSVGCASPISREYVIFLDPPLIAPTAEAVNDGSRAPPPLRTERTQPVRRAPQEASPSPTGDAGPPVRKTPRSRQPVAAAGARSEAQDSSRPTPTAPAAALESPVAPRGDRLTLVPTEAAVPGTPTSQAGPLIPPAAGPAATVTTPPTIGADEAAAREQALREQQTDLLLQVKALSDQIAVLKQQTTSLAARNQALEQSGLSSTVIWLLVLLAVLAILVAAWMAWRYRRLRRSIEGATWWTGNTVMAAPDGERSVTAETRGGPESLDPGTRFVPRSPGPAAAPVVASKVSASNVEGMRAGAPRARRDAAPLAYDFEKSGVEAAVASVRTVSPPPAAPQPASLDVSDIAAPGGATMRSPSTEPQPPRAVPAVRAIEVVEHHADDRGNYSVIDIPPQVSPRAVSSTAAVSEKAATEPTGRATDVAIEPLDFKFEIPQAFDPLAIEGLNATVIDRANQPGPMDFDPNGSSNSLDFEFPSTTQIVALTNADPQGQAKPPELPGAPAPDDLVAPQRTPGIDSVLERDERDGSPLSMTEVDRLTTSAVEGHGERNVPSTRALLARFAELMSQVDVMEGVDPLRAIALLRQYVLRDEKIPTLLWLRLFELYRKVDKKPVFEALAEHFARRYNRPMVGWTEKLSERVPQMPLSAMGPIDREIASLRGKDEGLERIRSLLFDRTLDDAVVFNAVLQRDLLDAAQDFPAGAAAQAGGDAAGS
jgi:hypothetical protein